MAAKLERLAGLQGSTAAECALITSVCPAAVALRQALTSAGAPHGGLLGFALDTVLLGWWPLLAVVAPERCGQLLATCAAGVAGSELLRRGRASAPRGQPPSVSSSVTAFRSSVLVGTCAAILAVDFQHFPLRLAKTHAAGTGLMDLGAGAFIFAHGLVSRDARGGGAHTHVARRVTRALRGSSALLALGLGRLASTTASGYVVPIDEYGAHWNFFITIAAVRLLAALVAPARGVLPALGWCALAAAAHELALRRAGLAAWLDSPVRGADVFSQNREGLVSVPGYVALHFAGVALGRCIYTAPKQRSAAIRAVCAALVAWTAWHGVTLLVGSASRRAANAAYGAWVTAHCTSLVAAHAVVDTLVPGPPPALVTSLEGKHVMLATFLAANVMTGLVNLSVDTLAVGNTTALAVLVAYQTAVCAAAVAASRLVAG